MDRYLGRSRPLPARGLVKPELFSDEDWDEYFACRERYDRPVALAEIQQLLAFYRAMSAQGRQKEALIITSKRLPLQPHIALYAKHHLGLKAIRNFNLYEARKAYPEEF